MSDNPNNEHRSHSRSSEMAASGNGTGHLSTLLPELYSSSPRNGGTTTADLLVAAMQLTNQNPPPATATSSIGGLALMQQHQQQRARTTIAPTNSSNPNFALRQLSLLSDSILLQQQLQKRSTLDVSERNDVETTLLHSTSPPALQAPEVVHRCTAAAPAGMNRKGPSNLPPSSAVPCRARGMPADHTFQTAHFIIPDDVQHGQDLLCSFKACREAGPKFRYCGVCHLPVARKNFNKRHNHCGIMGKPPGTKTAAAVAAAPPILNHQENDVRVANDAHNKTPDPSAQDSNLQMNQWTREFSDRLAVAARAIMALPNHNPTALGYAFGPAFEEVPHHVMASSNQRGDVGGNISGSQSLSSLSLVAPGETNTPPTTKTRSNSFFKTDQENSWADLLQKRPESLESNAMSGWLMQVMAISSDGKDNEPKRSSKQKKKKKQDRSTKKHKKAHKKTPKKRKHDKLAIEQSGKKNHRNEDVADKKRKKEKRAKTRRTRDKIRRSVQTKDV